MPTNQDYYDEGYDQGTKEERDKIVKIIGKWWEKERKEHFDMEEDTTIYEVGQDDFEQLISEIAEKIGGKGK